jgi:F420-dependent oxidoreductase-like protein
MRIGISATSRDLDEIIEQARTLEADGFSSLWFGSPILGDPMAGMAVVGRATSTIELGTSVVQTYPCHPILQANRITSVANAAGRSVTLGIGPSQEVLVRGVYGNPYDRPGLNAEEYTQIVTSLLRGGQVDFTGEEWSAHGALSVPLEHPVPVLLSAMSPRMLRVAGQYADGTITFLAGPKALEEQVVLKLRAAASEAGRPAPRVVAGLQIGVHDDADALRAQVEATTAKIFDNLAVYKRVLAAGGYERSAEAAVVGDEASVRAQLERVLDAGATDIWASPIVLADDAEASRRRTLDLLAELTSA